MKVSRWCAVCIVALWFVGVALAGATESVPASPRAFVGDVRFDSSNSSIVIELSGRTAYQLIQVDERELLLALKNVGGPTKPLIPQAGDPMIETLSLGRFPGDILGLVIHTKNPVKPEDSQWLDNGSHLLIRLKS